MRSLPLPLVALLSLGALDCAIEVPEPSVTSPVASVVASSDPEASTPSPADATPMPGPARARRDEALRLNAACVGCHRKEADEWRGSRHRRSDTNAAYRAAFAIEPSSFCRGCHAPESDPEKEPSRSVSELGVGCVTCHVTEPDTVLTALHDAPIEGAPHRLLPSRAFGSTGGCAGCHEFNFPGVRGDDERLLMQTTIREHGRSTSAAAACASCHLPLVDGHRSHAFASTRDPAWLKKNLHAEAEATGEGVRVTLAQPAPGHAFPTGDLFRRLEVGCEVRAESGAIIGRETRHLARHFQRVPGQTRRELTRDDRVFDEPVTVDLPVKLPTGGRARWWVSYQRVATVGDGADATPAVVESEVLLHAGELLLKP